MRRILLLPVLAALVAASSSGRSAEPVHFIRGLDLQATAATAGTGPLCVPSEAVLRIEDCYDPSDGSDWLPALRRAIESFPGLPYPGTGGKIQFGPRTYAFSDTIDLDRTVVLEGQGTAGDFGATVLSFPQDTTGIVVHYAGTASDPARRGDRSVIRNLAVESAGGSTGHGIRLFARANLEYVYVNGFPEDGVHIVADVNHDPPTNANTWRMHVVFTTSNGRHGLYVDGGDTNTGVAVGLNSMHNGGWGVYDSSFLGNTYVGAHTAANTGGSYKSDNRNARNLFLNCYAEGDQPDAEIIAPAMVLGGLLDLATTCTTDTGTQPCDYIGMGIEGFIANFHNGLRTTNASGNTTVTTTLSGGQAVPGTAYELLQSGEPNWPYRMTFDDSDQWWKMRWANLGSGVAYAISVAATSEGHGQFWMPNGFYFGGGSSKSKQDAVVEGGVTGVRLQIAGAQRFTGWADAAPAGGSFNAGDVIWNTGASAHAGWRFDGTSWNTF